MTNVENSQSIPVKTLPYTSEGTDGKPALSRREFIKKTALGLGAVAGFLFLNSDSSRPFSISDVSAYYPVIEPLIGELSYTEISPAPDTAIYNFLPRKLDPEGVKSLYEYYANLKGKTFEYPFGDQRIPVTLDERSVSRRIMFIFPDTSPFNLYDPKKYIENYGSVTNVPITYKPVVVSYVSDKQDGLLVNEVCTETAQSAFEVTYGMPQPEYLLDNSNASPYFKAFKSSAQELISSSLGLAVRTRKTGLSYGEYRAKATTQAIYALPFLKFSEKEYSQIPPQPLFSSKT